MGRIGKPLFESLMCLLPNQWLELLSLYTIFDRRLLTDMSFTTEDQASTASSYFYDSISSAFSSLFPTAQADEGEVSWKKAEGRIAS
jgi:hypothetical protein